MHVSLYDIALKAVCGMLGLCQVCAYYRTFGAYVSVAHKAGKF